MPTVKQQIQAVLDRMDDDASFEEILYQLYLTHKVEQGERDVDHGRTVSSEEARARIAQWLDPYCGRNQQ